MDKVYLKIDGYFYDCGTEADLINEMNAQGVEEFETTEDGIRNGDLIYIEDGVVGTAFLTERGIFLRTDGTTENINLKNIGSGASDRLERLGVIII